MKVPRGGLSSDCAVTSAEEATSQHATCACGIRRQTGKFLHVILLPHQRRTPLAVPEIHIDFDITLHTHVLFRLPRSLRAHLVSVLLHAPHPLAPCCFADPLSLCRARNLTSPDLPPPRFRRLRVMLNSDTPRPTLC